MPNWCECDLYVSGPKKDLTEFLEKARTDESVLDHNIYVPYPKEFEMLDKLDVIADCPDPDMIPKLVMARLKGLKLGDGYNQGGYDWCLDNWGTKWGICDPVVVYRKNNRVKVNFRTAWSPPVQIIEAMSKAHASLQFQMNYFEGGSGFRGRIIIKGGDIKENYHSDYAGSRGG